MILPKSIPHSINCPSCQEHLANLNWDLHITTGSKYLRYYCDSCKNGFTTTKSDEISLKNYHNKKRSLVRKNKINNLGI